MSEVVTSHATDSSMMDARTNNFILYGKANVQYDGRKLSADQIDFNQSSNIARAKYIHDTARKKPDMPLLSRVRKNLPTTVCNTILSRRVLSFRMRAASTAKGMCIASK
ncbi:MAG: hypothetical protein QM743_02015 [Chitinophagaceae bacterium]